jgi:hypothetical protein
VGWDWVHLVRRPLIGLFYQPRMIDDECRAVGGMRIGRVNRSTWRKPAPMPLFPPQIPYDLTWAWTRASEVESRRVTGTAYPRTLHYVGYDRWRRVVYKNFEIDNRNLFPVVFPQSERYTEENRDESLACIAGNPPSFESGTSWIEVCSFAHTNALFPLRRKLGSIMC